MLDSDNFVTEDRMLRNTYFYENLMFTNKVNAASFGVGKEKEVELIKRVKLTLSLWKLMRPYAY